MIGLRIRQVGRHVPISTLLRKFRSMAVPMVYVSPRGKSTWPPLLQSHSAKRMENESSVTPSPCVLTMHNFPVRRGGEAEEGSEGKGTRG